MPSLLSKADLLSRLCAIAAAEGIDPASTGGDTVLGAQSAIVSKWFLGGRKVVYKFSCRLDEPARLVRFREMTTETSWGIPPLTLTVEKTSQRGGRVSESRTDKSVGGGGGTLNYGQLRSALEQAARDVGWQFTLEAGKVP